MEKNFLKSIYILFMLTLMINILTGCKSKPEKQEEDASITNIASDNM